MEEMLLDTNANVISDNELPEILQLLPSFKAKTVLELGAGIGYQLDFKVFLKVNLFVFNKRRFTTVLAKKAAKVTAVDFIEKFVEKNREVNSNFNNIDFIHGDVTKLEFQKNG